MKKGLGGSHAKRARANTLDDGLIINVEDDMSAGPLKGPTKASGVEDGMQLFEQDVHETTSRREGVGEGGSHLSNGPNMATCSKQATCVRPDMKCRSGRGLEEMYPIPIA